MPTGMNARENYLRAVRFERPDYVPMVFSINAACYAAYPQDWLFEQMARHPFLFPGFVPPPQPYVPAYAPVATAGIPFQDDFGCIWQTTVDGLVGTVTGHPLAKLDLLDRYVFPDPAVCTGIGPIDWAAEGVRLQARKAAGQIAKAGLRHGHTFLQLCDLMGYEPLLLAMSDEDPRLGRLLDGVEQFNQGILSRYLAIGVDVMTYAEDLGMQVGPMLSPAHFARYIQPSYRRLMAPARAAGVPIHMHSDGDIRLLADALLEGGVDVLNLQDLVNGVDWIAGRFGGRVCIDLDIDRQDVTVHGTPDAVDALIRREVETLGRREGGLMMVFGLYPGTPLANVVAVMDAMERYAFSFTS